MEVDELASRVGQEIGRSEWIEITQEAIDGFAAVSGDRQWIHVDAERARTESPFGKTVAHGFFTLSLLSRMAAQAFQIGGATFAINYGLNRVRFPAPVAVGSRIRGRFTIQSFEAFPGCAQVVWSVAVECEGTAKPPLVAEWVMRYYR